MSTISNVQPDGDLGTPPYSSLRHNPVVDLVLLLFRPGVVPKTSTTIARIKRHPLLWLFGLAYGLTWFGFILSSANPTALTQRNLSPFNLIVVFFSIGGCLWAAVIVSNATTGRRALLSRLLRWRVNIVWYLVALFFPAFYPLAGIAIHVILGGAMPQFPIMTVPPSSWAIVVAINIGTYIIGNFEEFSWRGVGLPRLQARFSGLNAALLLGFVQAVWHLPYFFVPNSIEQQLGPLLFLAWNIGLNIVIAWVFNNAKGSLLIAILFHAANDGWGGLLATPADLRPLYLSIGVLWAVAIVLVAVFGPKHLSLKSEAEIAPAITAD